MAPTAAPVPSAPPPVRAAEAALAKLGYARIEPVAPTEPTPEFWVRESGVPRRAFPVYVEGPVVPEGPRAAPPVPKRTPTPSRAIVVVGSDNLAEGAWGRLGAPIDAELNVLVLPKGTAGEPHWYRRKLSPALLLRLATGVAVGLYRRQHSTEAGAPLDISEMLGILTERFGVDVAGSLGVESDEDALFLLYQLALRDAYAPGDPGANLHLLVLKPTGPAARLPWFAA